MRATHYGIGTKRVTIKQTFVCNVCRSDHFNSSTVVGMKWETNNKLVEDAAERAPVHICVTCYKAIKAVMEDRESKGCVP